MIVVDSQGRIQRQTFPIDLSGQAVTGTLPLARGGTNAAPSLVARGIWWTNSGGTGLDSNDQGLRYDASTTPGRLRVQAVATVSPANSLPLNSQTLLTVGGRSTSFLDFSGLTAGQTGYGAVISPAFENAAGVTEEHWGVYIQVVSAGASATAHTTQYGLRIKTPLKDADIIIDNTYGLYVEDHTASATGAVTDSFAIYVAAGNSYLGGNLGITTTAFGTSAAGNLAVKNGTAPSGSVTDVFHLFAADAAAGKAWPVFREEGNTSTTRYVVGVSGTSGVSTGTGTVKMNGATSRDSVGWLTLHDHAGNTVYVPYWTTITG